MPGPWSPPGNQPAPFYIGNEAHQGIADFYRGLHPFDPVFTNSSSLAAIAPWLGGDPAGLGNADLLRPDILNARTREIYEIKPAGSEPAGAAQLAMYMRALSGAGVTGLVPGAAGALGTVGAIPAPGGAYAFASLSSGIISYRYIPTGSPLFLGLPDLKGGPVVVVGAATMAVVAAIVAPELYILAPAAL